MFKLSNKKAKFLVILTLFGAGVAYASSTYTLGCSHRSHGGLPDSKTGFYKTYGDTYTYESCKKGKKYHDKHYGHKGARCISNSYW